MAVKCEITLEYGNFDEALSDWDSTDEDMWLSGVSVHQIERRISKADYDSLFTQNHYDLLLRVLSDLASDRRIDPSGIITKLSIEEIDLE